MIKLLLIGQDNEVMLKISTQLEQMDDIAVTRAYSKWKVLDLLPARQFDAAIIDEFVNGKPSYDLARFLTTLEPMISCSLVSSLEEETFHKLTEGLGVLAQISCETTADDVVKAIGILRQILFQLH